MKTNELPPRGLDIVRKFRETLIYRPNGRLLVGFAHRDWRFASRLIIGTGAGYIGGFTAYFAFRSDSRDWWRNYRGERGSLFSRLTGIEAGITHEPPGSFMSGTSLPSDDPTGEKPIRRRMFVRDGEERGMKFEPSYGWISAWDGKPKGFSYYA